MATHRHRPCTGAWALWTPHISGQFIERIGRCIYGGIYSAEGSPLSRCARLSHATSSTPRARCAFPHLRWPGGNFVSGYDWMDGLGPEAARPRPGARLVRG